MRFPSVALLGLLATIANADEIKKVLSKTHETNHAIIEEELRQTVTFPKEQEKSYTCTLTGAAGQEQCDAATDDDGTNCVWCVLNNFGFCVSAEQAQQFEQVMPTIDCDDSGSDDDKTPAADDDKAPDDGRVFNCLEKKDENSCGEGSCVWCNTKGGFGVCLTPEGAEMAKDSYWFDCPDGELEEKTPAGQQDEEEEMEQDWNEGEEEEEEEDYDQDYEEEDEGMHEFVVDTTCVLSGMLLDPTDDEATSETACFQARDLAGNPCEWCAISGSPFRICLSEPQAQVAEYVGAVCTGSDESFEPEDFDDSCIAQMHADSNLGKEGCWMHKDLDGNGCEWCNIMGVELCLGGVQAELVEHWGATCVLDHEEHAMAQAAIAEHKEYVAAKKEAQRIQKQAQGVKEEPTNEDDEEEMDLDSLWLTSDPSCMVTTLRVSGGDDELACAQTQDAQGNPCNWCQMGTSFYMCMNDEQADVAEYLGIQCETISTETQEILRDHLQRAEEQYEDEVEDGEYEQELMNDVEDFDNSCIMTMSNGPDRGACVNAKDQDGASCEWCTWNQFQVCLSSEQAEMVEPFGVQCDTVSPRPKKQEAVQEVPVLKELSNSIDTSCLIDAGQYNDPEKCTSAKDAITGKPCEWCSLGSLGFNACMSAEQADLARPLGVTCGTEAPAPKHALLQTPPQDFWSCLSQSTKIDECDETCTWCDLKGSTTGAGLCLSDPIADAVLDLYPQGPLDCAEPQGEVDGEDDEESESDDDSEEESESESSESDDDEEEAAAAANVQEGEKATETVGEETAQI